MKCFQILIEYRLMSIYDALIKFYKILSFIRNDKLCIWKRFKRKQDFLLNN